MPFYDNDDGVLATDTVAARKIIMKVVISDGIEYALNLNYRTIDIESTDYTNIAAIVVTMTDLPRVYQRTIGQCGSGGLYRHARSAIFPSLDGLHRLWQCGV